MVQLKMIVYRQVSDSMQPVERRRVDELEGNVKMSLWRFERRKLMEPNFSTPRLLSRSLKPFSRRHEYEMVHRSKVHLLDIDIHIYILIMSDVTR